MEINANEYSERNEYSESGDGYYFSRDDEVI